MAKSKSRSTIDGIEGTEYSLLTGFPTFAIDDEKLSEGTMPPAQTAQRVVRLDNETVVKYGTNVRLDEAEAMHFIAQSTTIILPKVLTAYTAKGVTYIAMSCEYGRHLPECWDSATNLEKENILKQLGDYVRQMQNLKGDKIGTVSGGPCKAGIFEMAYQGEDQTCGPFDIETEFNEAMVQALYLSRRLEDRNPEPGSAGHVYQHILAQTIRSLEGHETVFCHADLHPNNMLIRDDGTLVLLDWELAGFWPSYWEFCRAMWVLPWKPEWQMQIEKVMEPHYLEFKVIDDLWQRLVGGG